MTTPQAPAAPKKKRGGLIAAISVVGVFLLASLLAVGFLLFNPASASANEIVLEAADSIGRDPFSSDPFASSPPKPTATPAPAPSAAPAAAPAVSGGTPGLYGGTQDIGKCDAAQLVSFLEANPDKANAWVAALNADPTLRWPGGALAASDIRAYVATLQSVVLMADTRVTNHGFANGQPTPLQSVLQAGTAVLVDNFGVPRARCYCGNPLIPAKVVPAEVPIVGTPWPGFDPNLVVIVVGSNGELQQLLLGNLLNPSGPLTSLVLPPLPSAGTNTAGATPAPSGSATPSPTGSATPSPTPTPSATAAPPSGGPTPPAGFDCGTFIESATWIKYDIPGEGLTVGATYDIWRIDSYNCTAEWQITWTITDDGYGPGTFTWMGYEGENVVLTPAGSTAIAFSGTVPVGGGLLQ